MDGSVYHQGFGRPAVRIGRDSRLGPTSDPKSGTAAWLSARRLVVFDTARGKVEARTPVRSALPRDPGWPTPHPILFVGRDRVTFEAGAEIWEHRWPTDRNPSRTGLAAAKLIDGGHCVDVLAGQPVTDGRIAPRLSLG